MAKPKKSSSAKQDKASKSTAKKTNAKSSKKAAVTVKTKVLNEKSSSKKTRSGKAAKISSSENEQKTRRRLRVPAALKGKSPFRGYFTSSWQEIRRVKWPKRREAWKLTLSVIVFSVVFAAFLASLDYVFEKLAKIIFMQ